MIDRVESAAGPTIARLVVSTGNLAASGSFYRRVVGLAVTREAEGFIWLATADGVELMLHERPSQSSDAAVSIGFFVSELDAVVDAWREQGGVILDPPARQPWGERMAVVRDADGHIVCLSERDRLH